VGSDSEMKINFIAAFPIFSSSRECIGVLEFINPHEKMSQSKLDKSSPSIFMHQSSILVDCVGAINCKVLDEEMLRYQFNQLHKRKTSMLPKLSM
jgi:hypothetical protein